MALSFRASLAIVVFCVAVTQSSSYADSKPTAEPLRIGLTPVFLDNRVSFLRAWQTYLVKRLGRPVEFVQRQTYREITDLILAGEVQAAWICGFPYVRHPNDMKLLAVPVYQGAPLYQSYLIVSAVDRVTQDLLDLSDKIFAYSDPDSNSGYLVPTVALRRWGHNPDTFFRKAFFTWAHEDVVVAVADGLAQAGAVDGYVWDSLRNLQPQLVARTRIVTKSEKFGFPPFITSVSVARKDFKLLQDTLLNMDKNPEGVALLRELNLDGFIAGDVSLYDGIRGNLQYVESGVQQ